MNYLCMCDQVRVLNAEEQVSPSAAGEGREKADLEDGNNCSNNNSSNSMMMMAVIMMMLMC